MSRYTVAPPDPRFVIVHYHILKNGGSTIESILEREFGDGFAALHGERADAVLGTGDLSEFLRERPEVSAVSSHHLRYPLMPVPGTIVFDCCFLRHPLSRLQSVYSWFRRTQSTDRLCMKARQHGSPDFMRFLLDEMPNMVCDVQVTQLARAGAFTRPANGRDLKRAANVFRNMAFPGVVEMFDESLVAAEYFLRPAFPRLSTEYVAQNVSPVSGSNADPQEKLVSLWGSALYDQLTRMNRYDLKLFRFAQGEIARRLDMVPESGRRIREFEMRCKGLRRHAASAG